MQPQVLGEERGNPLAYQDMTSWAIRLRELPREAVVWAPLQGSVGDCWLLSAALGLLHAFPTLFQELVSTSLPEAVVTFPRQPPMNLNYVFPVEGGGHLHGVRLRRESDLYWALLEKAMSLLLFRLDRDRCLSRRKRRYPLAAGIARPHYSDLHGGRVSCALSLLVPSNPPRRAVPGLRFLQIRRCGCWHVMLVVRVTSTAVLAYDTWGYLHSFPPSICAVFYPLF